MCGLKTVDRLEDGDLRRALLALSYSSLVDTSTTLLVNYLLVGSGFGRVVRC